jgi:hypothetical protein
MMWEPPDLAAWARLARGWPIELGARWLAAEWGRVTPRSALSFGEHAAASWLVVDGDELRRGYQAYDLVLGSAVEEALVDAGRTGAAELARCAALRTRAAPLREARTVTITTTASYLPGIVWDVELSAKQAAHAVREVVTQVTSRARQQSARVLAVAHVPETAAFAPVRTALAELGLVRSQSAPDSELAVPSGGLEPYLRSSSTAIRREQRAFARGVDRVVLEDAQRLLAPDLVPLLAAQRAKYGHADGEAAFRDRLVRTSLLGDHAKVLIAERAGRVVGFTAFVFDPAHGRLVPRLFACEPNHLFAYFNLAYYEPIRIAAAWGLRTIALGTSAYRAKLLRGVRLQTRSTWFAALDDDLRGVMEEAASYRSELEAARCEALAVLQR